MTNEDIEGLRKVSKTDRIRQWCKSKSQIIDKKNIVVFKNPICFLGLFFVGIPLLFIPLSFIPTEISHPVSIILSIIIGISVFLNLNYVWLTFKKLNSPKAFDHQNVLRTVENISRIQWIGAITALVSIGGFIFLANAPTSILSSTSESIRLLLLYMLMPSAISVVFSTMYVAFMPTGKKYDLYLVNAWLQITEKYHTDSEKIICLKKCIENYDDFLYRVIQQRIENLDKMYAKFLLHSSKDIETITTEIKEQISQGEFSLLKYMQEYKNDDDTSIITINPLKHTRLTINAEMIKALSTILGSSVTATVVVLKLLNVF